MKVRHAHPQPHFKVRLRVAELRGAVMHNQHLNADTSLTAIVMSGRGVEDGEAKREGLRIRFQKLRCGRHSFNGCIRFQALLYSVPARFGAGWVVASDDGMISTLPLCTSLWKSCSRVLSEESASKWCRLRERASSGSGFERASASSHERVGGEGRKWRVRFGVGMGGLRRLRERGRGRETGREGHLWFSSSLPWL
ncbi:hypothetical protein LR48_Vigan11g151200 [Vigna angularis]|uniref:Uncharacterized protein n=1 Tax=Phaseolus angularis TaxID=3914 RepID=A0A0L9VU93_PHAAN|nr:hypothetical protein LR48_Vigan11g151200 [Vigna angularis]